MVTTEPESWPPWQTGATLIVHSRFRHRLGSSPAIRPSRACAGRHRDPFRPGRCGHQHLRRPQLPEAGREPEHPGRRSCTPWVIWWRRSSDYRVAGIVSSSLRAGCTLDPRLNSHRRSDRLECPKIVRETVNILLEGTLPRGMDLTGDPQRNRRGQWCHRPLTICTCGRFRLRSSGLSAHVVVEDQSLADSEHVMRGTGVKTLREV